MHERLHQLVLRHLLALDQALDDAVAAQPLLHVVQVLLQVLQLLPLDRLGHAGRIASAHVIAKADERRYGTAARRSRTAPRTRRAPARGGGVGDVRLRELRLHDGRHHRGLQRLLRRGGRGRRPLGDAGVDGGARRFLRRGHDHRSAGRRVRRPAGGQTAAARHDHARLRHLHRGARARGAGGSRARLCPGRAVELLLQHRREPDRRLPPRAGPGQGAREGVGVGLGARLHRWSRLARCEPCVRDGGAGARRDRGGLRAGDDAHHRGDLPRRQPADAPLAQGARGPAGCTGWARPGGLRAGLGHRSARCGLHRPRPVPRLPRLLPGRGPGGGRAGGDLRPAGDGIHHQGHDHADPRRERHGGARGGRVRPVPGPARPPPHHRADAPRLDRDRRRRLVGDRPRDVLGRGEPRGPEPRRLAVGGAGAGRLPLAARPSGRVLRAVGAGGEVLVDSRAAHLRLRHLALGRRPPPGDADHRRVLRGRAGRARDDRRAAGTAGGAARGGAGRRARASAASGRS